MSKLNSALLEKALEDILSYSRGETVTINGVEKEGKKRNFMETVECQITLKNYDPVRDKRFSGSFKLPTVPRPNLKCCILGNAAHCEQADRIGVDFMSVEDLKKRNKNKNKAPPAEPPAKLVENAFTDLRVHARLLEQDIARSDDFRVQLHKAVPTLTPYGSNQYAAVRAVLDWDHQLPSDYMLLRIYTAYSRHEARLLDTQIRARDQAIASDNVYPEFDLPDYGDLDASDLRLCCERDVVQLVAIDGEPCWPIDDADLRDRAVDIGRDRLCG